MVGKKSKKSKSDHYYTCGFCQSKLEDWDALKVHIDSTHSHQLFKHPCEYCDFNAEGPRFLRDHQNEKHADLLMGGSC